MTCPQLIIDKKNSSLSSIPRELSKEIRSLGQRPNKNLFRKIIIELCQWGPFTSQQIAEILGKKDKKHLVDQHLIPLVQEGKLRFLYPEDPSHPNQAYST